MYKLILTALFFIGCGCPQDLRYDRTTVRRGYSCYNSSCNRQPAFVAGPFDCTPRSRTYIRTEFRCWDSRDFIMVYCGNRQSQRPGCYYQGDLDNVNCDVTHVCEPGFW